MGFGVILADPPWLYRNTQNGAAAKHYPCMSFEQLAALQVQQWANDDAVLVLWATWPMLPQALDLVDAWGFRYTTGFPWIKSRGPLEVTEYEIDGLVNYGPGYWVRGASELILISKRGSPSPGEARNYVGLVSPLMRHSRKPSSVHAYCEALDSAKYGLLELFARSSRPGWTTWGNELGVEL